MTLDATAFLVFAGAVIGVLALLGALASTFGVDSRPVEPTVWI